MTRNKPKWFDEWVISESGKWHLKSGAPEEVKKAFKEFIKPQEDTVKAFKKLNNQR